MTCKHNRVIKMAIVDKSSHSLDIEKQYIDIYVCSQCGSIAHITFQEEQEEQGDKHQ